MEPIMTAGIGEQHEAATGTAFAAGAILAWATLLRGSQTGGAQDAANRFAAEREAFLLDEFLMQVGIVEPGIASARQLQDLLADGGIGRPGWGATGIAVEEPVGGIGLETALEAEHLAFTASE